METASIIVTWLTATGERILVKHDNRMIVVQLDTWMMPVATRDLDEFVKALQDNAHHALQIQNADKISPKLNTCDVDRIINAIGEVRAWWAWRKARRH